MENPAVKNCLFLPGPDLVGLCPFTRLPEEQWVIHVTVDSDYGGESGFHRAGSVDVHSGPQNFQFIAHPPTRFLFFRWVYPDYFSQSGLWFKTVVNTAVQIFPYGFSLIKNHITVGTALFGQGNRTRIQI